MNTIEHLEARALLAAFPTALEQYMLVLVNRARMYPAAEAARLGIDLNEGLAAGTINAGAKQPLAFNAFLNSGTDAHTAWMLDADVFSHTGENGTRVADRILGSGYTFNGRSVYGENLGYAGLYGPLPEAVSTLELVHRNLFVDTEIAGRGHRIAMMYEGFRETGIGISDGVFRTGRGDSSVWMMSEDFVGTPGNPFLTGVVFADTMRRDGLYTPYEGLGGVTVEATSLANGGVYRTQTWDAGGFSLQVPPGQYAVMAYGGELSEPMVYGGVTVVTDNVLLDFPATELASMPQITAGGVLLVLGTGESDTIVARDLGDRIRVERNGASYEFARGLVGAIQIHGGVGDDLMDVGANLPMAGISGDDGNDTILGGSGRDFISGNAGNDVLNGRFGDDSISGGAGDDLLSGRAGLDTLRGGGGVDTILAGNGDDVLFGGAGGDQLAGGAGVDLAGVADLLDSVVEVELT